MQRPRLALYKLLRAALVTLLLWSGGLNAQEPERGEELTVYLVTIGYGDAVWQKFGHNAIRISNSADGLDLLFNYGVFDFATPGFLYRFLLGTTFYWLEAHEFLSTVEFYIAENRTIWLQELNLTPHERAEVLDFLLMNAREENRYYRYDYFLDNCSTRVADALDRAVGGMLREQLQSRRGQTTYREEALRLTSRSTVINWGVDLALGPAADVTPSAWQEAFIPMRLRDHVRTLSLRQQDGSLVPLVTNEAVIFEARRDAEPEVVPSLLPAATTGALAALVILGVGLLNAQNRAAAVLFAVAVVGWSLVTGLVGITLGAVWLFTDHVAAHGNQNLLQASPLALILAVIAPVVVLVGRARRLGAALAFLLAGISILGLLLNLGLESAQANGRIIALALPVHVAVAAAMGARALPRYES